MQFKKFILPLLFFNFLTLAAQELDFDSNIRTISFMEEPNFESYLVTPRVTFSHTEGKFFDVAKGYTSIGLFSLLPYSNNCFTTFYDVKGHFFNYEGRKAANVGAGLRYQLEENSWIFGINSYYDYRESAFHHAYHQLGLGLEFLGPNVDFRLNGYLPVGSAKAHSKKVRFTYPGGYYAIFENQQEAQGGIDGEVGSWIQKNNSETPLNLYGAVGGYYYASKKHFRSDYGFKARLESHFLDYFTFEIRAGYDDIYHGMGQGTLSVAIPLETFFRGLAAISTKSENTLYQPVKRQEIIFLSRKECYWKWNWNTPTIPCCYH